MTRESSEVQLKPFEKNSSSKQIRWTSFCSTEQGADLFAVGNGLKFVGKLMLILNGGIKASDDALQLYQWNMGTVPNLLSSLSLGTAMVSHSWAPWSSLSHFSYVHLQAFWADQSAYTKLWLDIKRLVLAGVDKRLYILDSKGDSIQPLSNTASSKAYIHQVALDKTEGVYLAILSDDKCLKIYKGFNEGHSNDEYQEPMSSSTHFLASRGVKIQFHAFLTEHLLVAEESGSIRFLNIGTGAWILSVILPNSTLYSVDWNPVDPNRFGAVANYSWFVWDLSEAPLHLPHHSGEAYRQGSKSFQWCPSQPRRFALLPQSTLKSSLDTTDLHVFDSVFKKVPYSVPFLNGKRIQSISWHPTRNLLLVADYQSLYFISLTTNESLWVERLVRLFKRSTWNKVSASKWSSWNLITFCIASHTVLNKRNLKPFLKRKIQKFTSLTKMNLTEPLP